MKDSFILYTEQKEIFDSLSNEEAGKLIKAIYEYTSTDRVPDLDKILKVAFIDAVSSPSSALDRSQYSVFPSLVTLLALLLTDEYGRFKVKSNLILESIDLAISCCSVGKSLKLLSLSLLSKTKSME